MIERAIDVESVALFCWTLKFKDQSKTVGVARQQLHFLCSDKENEAKESLTLRWACLVRGGCNLNPDGLVDHESTIPLQVTRLMRASPFVKDCSVRCLFCFSAVSHTKREAPR